MAETHVAVIGRYPVLSETICDGLAEVPGLHAVAADSYVDTIAEFVTEQRPDVLVVDSVFAGDDGRSVLAQLREVSPAPAVVVLTSHDDPEAIDHAVHSGALGFVLKVPPPDELMLAIRYAARGEIWLSPPLLTRVLGTEREPMADLAAPVDPRTRLTDDEIGVLDLLAEGLDQSDIAARLGRSRRTVATQLRSIRRKLGVHSSGEAVAIAKNGAKDGGHRGAE